MCIRFLVRLWSAFRVHFCQDQDHDDGIDPIGMYDSSNESSQSTEKGSVKRFDVLSKFFILLRKSIFCAVGSELELKVKYFKNFSSDFSKQGLKWMLITTASYFEGKSLIYFYLNFHKKCIFSTSNFFENFCFLPTYMFDFNKWGPKWKLITTASYFKDKNPIFFQKLEILAKNVFFYVNFFEKVCFLPIHMFDFNKWGVKWIYRIFSIYFNKKN